MKYCIYVLHNDHQLLSLMHDFASPLPLIRPALPLDKPDVAEFTKFIWDGHDYVGEAFPHWLEDPEGILLVAEYAGRCIGTGKVTRLAPGQWWLEGFRIDPQFQGLKIGSRLDAAANEWWDEHGDGIVRLMTSSQRVKVQHLCEARGFVKLGEVLAYESSPLAEATQAFTPLTAGEAEAAAAFCRQVAPGRLMDMGWRLVTPNADCLGAGAGKGFALWWRGGRGFLSAWEDEIDGGVRFVVGLEACAQVDRVELLIDVRKLASARGAAGAGWMGVVNESLLQDLERAGYKRAWEHAGFLYERFHP